MKKKMITLVAAAILVGALGVGTTLAYFSSEDEASNTVTMGNVTIDLKEKKDGVETQTGFEYGNVLPGDTLDKDVLVTVDENSQNAYVLVKVDYVSEGISDEKLSLLTFEASEDWTLVYNGRVTKAYMYKYNAEAATAEAMKASDGTLKVFDEVVVPGKEWTNDEANKKFAINVKAYAIQEAHLSATDALEELLASAGLVNNAE